MLVKKEWNKAKLRVRVTISRTAALLTIASMNNNRILPLSDWVNRNNATVAE